MNVRKIIEESDASEVAEALGIEMQKRGERVYIRCPGHEKRVGHPDRHIGNCVMDKNGYHCFSCGATVKTKDMVKEVLDCSDDDAYRFMADIIGDPSLYSDDPNAESDLPKLRLSSHEAEVIGLYPHFTKVINGKRYGLYELYKENPRKYYEIIVDSAKAGLKRYSDCLSQYGTVQAPKAYVLYDMLGPEFDSSIYAKLNRRLKEDIDTCNRIIKIFSSKLA